MVSSSKSIGGQAVVEVEEEHLTWLGQEREIKSVDQALARRWRGDTKSLHVSCSWLLQRTQVSPKACPGAESSRAKEVLAGESQACVVSKPWGQIAHPSFVGFSQGAGSHQGSPLSTDPQEASPGTSSP